MSLGISDLIEFLSNPSSYPHKTSPTIKVVQTQMSLVFITGDFVYKIHKSVDLGYVDYTSLEKRKYFCNQEVILNRRLSPDLYLGVIPITLSSDGRLSLSGEGETIEYAVKMKVLPSELMLDHMLADDTVTPDMMIRVAKTVSDFHKKAATSPEISQVGSIETLSFNAEENFQQLSPYIGRVFSLEQFERITSFTRSFLKQNEQLFRRRNAEGKTRDCHGDLHSQHICFTDPISIYDCIEFTDRFRYVDIAAEVSFLCMDLDHSGRDDLALSFLNAYIDDSHDEEIRTLWRYYKCYYACVRAKVNCFQLDDPLVSDEAKGRCLNTAREYLNLADHYTADHPTLFINFGTTGCGKTTLAKALSKNIGLIYISSDVTRKTLAHVDLNDHTYRDFNADIYSPEMTRKTYQTLYNNADEALMQGSSVILDAAFLMRDERLKAFEIAKKNDARFFVLNYLISDEATRSNILKRQTENDASDGNYDIYLMQLKTREPLEEFAASQVIDIDYSDTLTTRVNKILDVIDHE